MVFANELFRFTYEFPFWFVYSILYLSICVIAYYLTVEKIELATKIEEYESISKIVSYISSGLIIILIIEEVGLFTKEWGVYTRYAYPLEAARRIFGIKYIKYVVEGANIALIIPSIYTLAKRYYPGKYANSKKSAIIVSFLCLYLVLMFNYVQVLTWHKTYGEEYKFIYVIKTFFPFIIMFFFGYAIMKKLSRKAPYIKKFGPIPLLFCVTVASIDNVITKSTLLLVLIPRGFNYVTSFLDKLLGKSYGEKTKEHDVSAIVDRVSGARSRKNLFALSLFISSLSPFMIIWTLNVSPYPPLNIAFPKGQTFGLIATISLTIFVWSVVKENTSFTYISVSYVPLLASFYILPVLFPEWFTPPISPSGSTSLNSLNAYGNPVSDYIDGFQKSDVSLANIFFISISLFAIQCVLFAKIYFSLLVSKMKESVNIERLDFFHVSPYVVITNALAGSLMLRLLCVIFFVGVVNMYTETVSTLHSLASSDVFSDQAKENLGLLRDNLYADLLASIIPITLYSLAAFRSYREVPYNFDKNIWLLPKKDSLVEYIRNNEILWYYGESRLKSYETDRSYIALLAIDISFLLVIISSSTYLFHRIPEWYFSLF